MVCLYEKTATSFVDNGMAVLDPSVCTVHEVAGGEYELHLEHPMDDNGKFLLLTENRLIKAPVPPTTIPAITLPTTYMWKVTAQTPLYSKLPVYKKSQGSVAQSDFKKAYGDVEKYAFNPLKMYTSGSLAIINAAGVFYLYKAQRSSVGIPPGADSSVWAYQGNLGGGSGGGGSDNPTYTPGTVAETLAVDAIVTFIADVNSSYIKVKSAGGNIGCVARSDVVQTTTPHSGETIPTQTITEQVFRIYSVQSEDDTQTVVVDAMHISYDFAGNALFECKLNAAEPSAAIANLQSMLMINDDRLIASDITGKTITADWSYKNPINALLDPDSGLVPKMKAKLVRNNANIFVLDNSTPRTGINIEYGMNMLGVHWTRSVENVITRVMPRCKDGGTGYVYLDNLFVDSSNASQYPFHRIEVLNCNYQVGKEFTKPDGTKVTMNEASCKQQMQADAQARFSRDHVDVPDITLDVEFVLLGDTEEYKQYKNLQSVCLYDNVTVRTGKSNVVVTAMVTEYEYDSLLKRYNEIQVGEINTFGRRVSGYRLINDSIGIEKLAPDLVNQILSSGASTSESSGSYDGGGDGNGSGVATVVYDGLDHESTTEALSANQGKLIDDRLKALEAVIFPT